MRHFFITGLPRCRSAWFANLLTYGNRYGESFCFHDAWHGLESVEAIRPKLENMCGQLVHYDDHHKCRPVVGISDPALLLFWRQMAEWYPDAKWVVVLRDYKDAVKSCTKVTTPNRKVALLPMVKELGALVSELDPMVIEFGDITSETITKLENYLDVDFGPKERIEMLLKFNVQIDPALLQSSIANVLENPPSFLKAA